MLVNVGIRTKTLLLCMSTKKSITLAILADGMGGHRAGDVASRQAVGGLGTAWEKQN